MSHVVDHGHQAEGEEQQEQQAEAQEGKARGFEDVPVLNHLHEQTRQEAELRARRTRLCGGKWGEEMEKKEEGEGWEKRRKLR